MRPFPNDGDDAPRVLGVFAHPDDEVFCMGGTMAWLASKGSVGRIVSLTEGEAGQIRDAATATRSSLGAVRAAELSRAAEAIGAADARCHDFGDGTLASQDPGALADCIGAEIEAFAPNIVITFGRDGAYGHPDHIVASEATTVAVRRLPATQRPTLLHAAFPQTTELLLRQIVDWLTSLDDRFRGTEDFAHAMMLFADGSSMLGYAADRLDVAFYPAGTFVIEQGEPPGQLFLILSGTVSVLHEGPDGQLTHEGTRGPGCFVGEAGIASGQPRNAHVVADNSVTCFVLSPDPENLAAGRGHTADGGTVTQGSIVEGNLVESSRRRGLELVPADISVDVRPYCRTKVRALEAHRSQYALAPDVLPLSIAEGMLGTEYFHLVEH